MVFFPNTKRGCSTPEVALSSTCNDTNSALIIFSLVTNIAVIEGFYGKEFFVRHIFYNIKYYLQVLSVLMIEFLQMKEIIRFANIALCYQ